MKKFLIILLVLLLVGGLIFGLYYFLWTAENFASWGERAMESGNYSRAVSRYERAVSLDPDNPEYVLALADACIADGSYTKAERSLVTAIRTAPSAALYCKLSAVYVAQDKLFDAQKMLDSLTDPDIRTEIGAMRPAAPAFTPEGGEYSEYLSLSMEGSGAIYYSLTQEYPSTATAAYSEPIPLEAGQTHISAVAVGENSLVSPLAEADYLIVGVVEEAQFVSPELESLIRDTLYIARTEPIMTDQLWEVTELTVPESVTDLSDLRYFTNLTSLTVSGSSVSDFSALSGLTKLQTLDLTGCLLSEDTVELLGTLTSLRELHLGACSISNIRPLGDLTGLTVLDLSVNSISDIEALSGLSALEQLNLQGNAVSSLSALSGAASLKELDVSGNYVSSLEPLSGCGELEVLHAEGNRIASLSALSGMHKLTVLTASDNAIADVGALSGCTKLSHLELANNQIADIGALAGLSELAYLDVSRNQIATLPALEPTAHLQQFYASYNLLEDVSALAGLQELTYVSIDYNEEIEDIECLLPCPLLVQVDAFGTKVREVTALTDVGVIVNYNPVDIEDDTTDDAE